MVKNFDMFTIVLTQFTNVTDTQTDTHRHRMTAYAALMYSSAWQKLEWYGHPW